MTTDRYNRPFAPVDNSTANKAVGASTGNVAIKNPAAIGGQVANLRVFNNGTATAWIAFGGSGVVAVIAEDIPIGPGMAEVFTMPGNATDITHVAVIAAGATGSIYITTGYGI